MRRRFALSLVAGAFGLAGCVPSLNPLYTGKDLIFDSALVGTWVENDTTPESWTFTRVGDKSYRLVVREADKASPFEAHLVQLGSHRFLDLFPHEDGLDGAPTIDLYKAALVPAHLFLKVTQIEPTLQIAFLDGDWLKELLRRNPRLLSHLLRGEKDLVLTASTRDLQAFIVRHVDTKDAFSKPSNLKRQR